MNHSLGRTKVTLLGRGLLSLALLCPGCGDGGAESSIGEGAGDGVRQGAERSRPSVLLVSFDTTRADRIGAYGHAAARTPTLDALAERGLLFERAWAPAPMTLPSHTSMLTGVFPSAHGVHVNGVNRVGEQSVLISEALQDQGYRTGAFVGSFVLHNKYGLDQGFESYSAPSAAELSGSSLNRQERPAAEVVDEALAWTATVTADEPFFLWLHFNDPHGPYAPVEPYRSQNADAYDGEIATCDGELGRLLNGLSAAGRDDDLLVVVTSDHGESFGEFGERSHGLFVYDATMRVPLIVVPPGAVPGDGRRVSTPVSLTDIPATILQATGVDRSAMPAVQVPSLLDAKLTPASGAEAVEGRQSRSADRSLYIESMVPFANHRWHPLRGIIWRGHKLIDSPKPELYALPDEQNDLSEAEPELLALYRSRLETVLQRHGPLGWSEEQAMSTVDREQLVALGYIGLVGGGGDPFDESLPIARERIGDLVMLEQAVASLDGAQGLLLPGGKGPADDQARMERGLAVIEAARDQLLRFRQLNPGDARSATYLGFCEMALGRYDQAIEPLEQHALAVPNSPQTRFNLALCYWAGEHRLWAMAEMAKAVSVEPQADPAYHWLADRLLDAGRPGEALWWLQELQRVWEAPEADRQALAQRLAAVEGAARRAGQVSTAPSDYPPTDLTPERMREGADR
ncbi:MAG: arylsulfatase A-like enzyme [Pseudohongiellaceae bacterium]